MKKIQASSFIFLMSLVMMLQMTLQSCSSSKKQTAETPPPVEAAPTLQLNADSDSGAAGVLQSVKFDFDSATLSAEAKMILQNNAQFLKTMPTLSLQVEGHCDERGSVQYNMALGENRAKTVRDFLMAQGIEASRLSIISFGKERPLSFGSDEESWGKNRRANFVITGL